MVDVLFYLVAIVVLTGGVVGGGLLWRAYQSGTLPQMQFFAPKDPPRIDVVEQSNIDGRRRLLLIRRDDVEHLIMTGGPVDMVIETGIGERRSAPVRLPEPVEAPTPVYTRQPRKFGQVAGE